MRGFIALIRGMVTSPILPYGIRCTLTPDKLGTDASSWVPQFLYGTSQNSLRIRISKDFVGMRFKDAAVSMQSQHSTLLFALQRGEVRQLFPAEERLFDGDFVFVLVPFGVDVTEIQSDKEYGPAPAIENPLTVGSVCDPFQRCGYPTSKEERKRHMNCTSAGQAQERDDFEDDNVGTECHILKILQMPQFSGGGMAKSNQDDGEDRADCIRATYEEMVDETVPTSMEAHKAMMKRGRKIAKAGGHILLCGMSKDFWHIALSFLRPLRSRCIKQHRRVPVVVISKTVLPANLFDEYDDVAAVQQDPLRLNNLVHFGADTASRIVVLAGTDVGEERALVDKKVIMISNSIEAYLRYKGIQPYCEEKSCIYEIGDKENLKLLPPVPPDNDFVEPADDITAITNVSWRAVSGSLVGTNDLSMVFALAYNTPGIMEIFEALVSPSKSSAPDPAMSWLCRLPESYLGMAYKDLTAKLAAGTIPALTLGLWRAGGRRGSALGFVFSNPPACTLITEGDSVYVLAVADFADCLDDKNNLCLSDGAMDTVEQTLSGRGKVDVCADEPETDTALPIEVHDELLIKTVNKLFNRYNLNASSAIGRFRR